MSSAAERFDFSILLMCASGARKRLKDLDSVNSRKHFFLDSSYHQASERLAVLRTDLVSVSKRAESLHVCVLWQVEQ